MVSKIEWHFIDYPKEYENGLSDVVICKPTDPEEPLFTAVWDCEKKRWLDVGRDYDWFCKGVACWGDVYGVPETLKQMPIPKGGSR